MIVLQLMVVEEAIRYIDRLHDMLHSKLHNNHSRK